MSLPVTSAVIAAAGSATRMWPASKVFPKELLPLGRLPAIGYLAWEFAEAGIQKLCIVGTKSNLPAIQEFFTPSPPPGKVAEDPIVIAYLAALDRLSISFLEQQGPYGNGTPLLTAIPFTENKPCIYAFGDDIVLHQNVSASLIELYEQTGCPILSSQEVPASKVSSFGILEFAARNGIQYVTRLVEKPKPEETTSRLAALGRYLITPEILHHLSSTKTGRDNELWLVDSFLAHMEAGGDVATLTLDTGRWFTVGDPGGFCDAIVEARAAEAQPFRP